MILTYMTDDNVLVSIRHAGSTPSGQSKWQALVEGEQGIARWSVNDLATMPSWSSERVARHALECAQSAASEPCPCPDPDCPGKAPGIMDGKRAFGPSDPHAVTLSGPWFDREQAIAAVLVASGELDEDSVEHEPTIEELVAELDDKPLPGEEPPDPFKGSTWRLG